MRVVIDTNVFISSVKGGNPGVIIKLLDQGLITLCISLPIVEVYLRVFKRLGIPLKEMEKLVMYFEEADSVLEAENIPQLKIVEKDPDDDKFIECAVALNADYIITGDKALREVKKYKKIQIVSPREFLKIFYRKR